MLRLRNIEKMMKKGINKLLRNIKIFLFGIEIGTEFPVTFAWIENERLKELLEQDEYGVYKKADVRIPIKYKWKYKELQKARERQIFRKFMKQNQSVKYGFAKNHLLYDEFTEPFESDKIEMVKLLKKG